MLLTARKPSLQPWKENPKDAISVNCQKRHDRCNKFASFCTDIKHTIMLCMYDTHRPVRGTRPQGRCAHNRFSSRIEYESSQKLRTRAAKPLQEKLGGRGIPWPISNANFSPASVVIRTRYESFCNDPISTYLTASLSWGKSASCLPWMSNRRLRKTEKGEQPMDTPPLSQRSSNRFDGCGLPDRWHVRCAKSTRSLRFYLG